MRKSVLRWLLQRGKPQHKPLAMRTSWPDFYDRMHKAIALDMALLLGEITLAEVRRMQITRPLPTIHSAETLAEPRVWGWHECETVANVDEYATLPDIELAKR